MFPALAIELGETGEGEASSFDQLLRTLALPTPISVDISAPDEGGATTRVETVEYRVLRDTRLARALKTLHDNECQICGLSIDLANGVRYSEAHHIQPLGRPHDGPDVRGNILILCPNHHAMCDYGAIQLDVARLRTHPRHLLGNKFVAYHNERIASAGSGAL